MYCMFKKFVNILFIYLLIQSASESVSLQVQVGITGWPEDIHHNRSCTEGLVRSSASFTLTYRSLSHIVLSDISDESDLSILTHVLAQLLLIFIVLLREVLQANLARYSGDHHGKTSDHEMRTGPGPKNTFSVGFITILYAWKHSRG